MALNPMHNGAYFIKNDIGLPKQNVLGNIDSRESRCRVSDVDAGMIEPLESHSISWIIYFF